MFNPFFPLPSSIKHAGSCPWLPLWPSGPSRMDGRHLSTHTHAHKFIHRHPSLCMHVYALRIFILFIYIDVTYLKNKIKIKHIKPTVSSYMVLCQFLPQECQIMPKHQDISGCQDSAITTKDHCFLMETHRFHQTKMESRHVPTLFQNPWWLWWLCSEARKAPNTIQIHEARGFTQRSSACWQLLAAENPTVLGDFGLGGDVLHLKSSKGELNLAHLSAKL